MKRPVSPFDNMPPLLGSKSRGHDSSGNEKELDNDDEEKNVIRSWDEFDASTRKSVQRGPPRVAIFVSIVLLFISGVMIASKKNAQQRNYNIVDKNTENAIFSSQKPVMVTEVLSPPPLQTANSESINDQSSSEQKSEYSKTTTEEVVLEEEEEEEEEVPEEDGENEEEEQEVVTKKEKKNTVVKEFGKGATR